MLGKIEVGGGNDRGQDIWVASLTQLTWVWASSRRWQGTGKPSMLARESSSLEGACFYFTEAAALEASGFSVPTIGLLWGLSWAVLPASQLSQGSGMWERGKKEDAIMIASQAVSRLLGGDLIFHLSAPLDCKFFWGWTHIGFPFTAVTRHSNGLVVRYSVKTEGMHLLLEDTLKSTRLSRSLTEWHFNHLQSAACSLNLINSPVSLLQIF